MVLYILTILISMIIIGVVDYFAFSTVLNIDLPYIVVGVVFTTIAVIIVDLIFAFVVRRMLPSKWFSEQKTFYMAGKKERRFYEKIAIKSWKEKVIELGALSGFRKNKIAKPDDASYIQRYIIEANYGIIVHVADIVFGFLVIFLYPLKFWYCFGFPVAIVNAVLNLLPMFILRYNLPKLHKLYSFNMKKQNKDL